MKGIIFSSTQLRVMCSGWATSDELPLPPLGLVPGGWCFGVAAFESCFYSARRGQGKLELSECSTTWAGGGRRPALARCEWKGLRARENICNLCVFLSDLRWFFPAIDVEDKDLLHTQFSMLLAGLAFGLCLLGSLHFVWISFFCPDSATRISSCTAALTVTAPFL